MKYIQFEHPDTKRCSKTILFNNKDLEFINRVFIDKISNNSTEIESGDIVYTHSDLSNMSIKESVIRDFQKNKLSEEGVVISKTRTINKANKIVVENLDKAQDLFININREEDSYRQVFFKKFDIFQYLRDSFLKEDSNKDIGDLFSNYFGTYHNNVCKLLSINFKYHNTYLFKTQLKDCIEKSINEPEKYTKEYIESNSAFILDHYEYLYPSIYKNQQDVVNLVEIDEEFKPYTSFVTGMMPNCYQNKFNNNIYNIINSLGNSYKTSKFQQKYIPSNIAESIFKNLKTTFTQDDYETIKGLYLAGQKNLAEELLNEYDIYACVNSSPEAMFWYKMLEAKIPTINVSYWDIMSFELHIITNKSLLQNNNVKQAFLEHAHIKMVEIIKDMLMFKNIKTEVTPIISHPIIKIDNIYGEE